MGHPNGAKEFTLSELLIDPVTRAAMRADRLDSEAFASMMKSVAARIRTGQGSNRPVAGAPFLLKAADYLPYALFPPDAGKMNAPPAAVADAPYGCPCAW